MYSFNGNNYYTRLEAENACEKYAKENVYNLDFYKSEDHVRVETVKDLSRCYLNKDGWQYLKHFFLFEKLPLIKEVTPDGWYLFDSELSGRYAVLKLGDEGITIHSNGNVCRNDWAYFASRNLERVLDQACDEEKK